MPGGGGGVASRGAPLSRSTDVRRALPTGNNPMIGQGLSKIFNGVDPLCGWLADWSADARSALY
jgi:hypothetical protein